MQMPLPENRQAELKCGEKMKADALQPTAVFLTTALLCRCLSADVERAPEDCATSSRTWHSFTRLLHCAPEPLVVPHFLGQPFGRAASVSAFSCCNPYMSAPCHNFTLSFSIGERGSLQASHIGGLVGLCSLKHRKCFYAAVADTLLSISAHTTPTTVPHSISPRPSTCCQLFQKQRLKLTNTSRLMDPSPLKKALQVQLGHAL